MVSAEMQEVVNEVQNYIGGRWWIKKIQELMNSKFICIK
jgi:hypothetical protein